MRADSILKPSHSANVRELRPIPTTPKAMRHFEKNENLFLRAESILNPSHSANMRELRPMPTTPKAMRHFEKNENRLSRSEKHSQTVSLPPKSLPRTPIRGRPLHNLRHSGEGGNPTPSPVVGEGWSLPRT